MTYQEAVEFKGNLGREVIQKSEITLIIFVVPFDHSDLMNMFKAYRSTSNWKDEYAINFCQTGIFTVMGMYTDGTDVIYEDLNK